MEEEEEERGLTGQLQVGAERSGLWKQQVVQWTWPAPAAWGGGPGDRSSEKASTISSFMNPRADLYGPPPLVGGRQGGRRHGGVTGALWTSTGRRISTPACSSSSRAWRRRIGNRGRRR
jgi:hypothetical protein